MKEQSKTKIKENISTLGRILKAHKIFRIKILAVFLFLTASISLWALSPLIVSKLTNLLVEQFKYQTEDRSFDQIFFWLSVLGFCYLGAIIFDRYRWIFEVRNLDCGVQDHLAGETVGHIRTLSIGQHRGSHSIVATKKIEDGERAVRDFLKIFVYEFAPILVAVTAAFSGMLIVFPLVGVVAVICGVGVFVTGVFVARKHSKPIKRVTKFRQERVGKTHGELIRHLDSLKVAVEDGRYSEDHFRIRRKRAQIYKLAYVSLGKWFALIQFWANAGRLLSVSLASYMIFIGKYEIGALTAVFAWCNQSLGQLTNVQRIFRSLTENWSEISQYFQIMDTPPAIKVPENAIELPFIEGEIVFENVHFAYPGTEEDVLSGINLKIKPGQKVGIVGPSGAGKSTILSLLQGAFLPQIGSVRIDGFDMANLELSNYRSKVGFVEQKPYLFAKSLRENLLFGVSQERRSILTDTDLKSMLCKVGLSDLEGRLGESAGEFGKKLSVGQCQRIAIARILLDPPDMLICDEATAAVDPESERLVHEALDNVSLGSTRIFVAHRLSTVQDSDVIFVIDKGQVVGQGTHEELSMNCHLYQRLVRQLLIRT